MAAEVVEFNGITTLDVPAERVLRKAQEAGLVSVIVVGITEDDEEYFASSFADGGDVLWHLERAKLRLLTIGE